MASSVGIACPGNGSVVLDQASKLKIKNRFDIAGARPCSVAVCDRGRSGWKSRRISATMTAGGSRNRMSLEPLGRKEGGGGGKNDTVDAYERLDKWMRDSVVDIVKNLKEAPLLVQLYSNGTGKSGGKATALSTEKKAAAEDWPMVKEKWLAGEAPLPEGIIFVEELAGYEAEHEKKEEERTTRAWGLVVQGQRVGCGPVCYLLKTCRVGSGMGMFCTHFCLMRVTNLRETVDSQLKNCWLLQTQ